MTERTRLIISGVLLANAVPHLASAVAGRRHLTPLAGRNSSPQVNAVWAGINLLGGGLLLGGLRRSFRWGSELRHLEEGALGWMIWMALSERVLGINSGDDQP